MFWQKVSVTFLGGFFAREGGLKYKNELETVLPKFHATKIARRSCHVNDMQRIHHYNNTLDAMSYPNNLLVNKNYYK